jgi:hypothetical protein
MIWKLIQVFLSIHTCFFLAMAGCDHSRFLVVPDWYGNGCCCVLALEQTQYSMLNVYVVFKNKVHKVQVSEKYVQTTR